MKKVILAGGSGYIGSVLADFYSESADVIVVLTRGKSSFKGNVRAVQWNGKDVDKWVEELEGADLLVNLRAEGDPDHLLAATRGALDDAASAAGIRHHVRHVEHFRPGQPTPTYRLSPA